LLTAASSVGALGLLHELTPGHSAHDESTCQLGVTLRAPISHSSVPTPELSLLLQTWPSDPVQPESSPRQILPSTITCRGPPGC
jgi:hypothetical protein